MGTGPKLIVSIQQLNQHWACTATCCSYPGWPHVSTAFHSSPAHYHLSQAHPWARLTLCYKHLCSFNENLFQVQIFNSLILYLLGCQVPLHLKKKKKRWNELNNVRLNQSVFSFSLTFLRYRHTVSLGSVAVMCQFCKPPQTLEATKGCADCRSNFCNECFKLYHPWGTPRAQHEHIQPTLNFRPKVLKHWHTHTVHPHLLVLK